MLILRRRTILHKGHEKRAKKGGSTLEILIIVVFVISLLVSAGLVNKVQQMYMKFMGASGMFFSGKKKLFAIVLIAFFLTGFVMKIFGL